MTTHHQRVEVSASSVLAVCSCGWREMVKSAEAAWRIAADHGWAVHADGKRASKALSTYSRRHP